jgi:hypothetical protein
MARAHPNQDRYIVISLPTASRKAIHIVSRSSAGYGTAYPIPCLNPHSPWFFAILQSALHWSRTHIKLKSFPTQPQPPGLVTVHATQSP